MQMKISFDSAGNPEEPTFVLATRSGQKLGKLNARSIVISDALKEPSEFSCKVYKYNNNEIDELWDSIKNFKLVWCKDYDIWFQITVDLDEDTETIKTVYGTRLGQAELSQIMLYEIEINTENDIAREDYTEPTVFWNDENHSASLLHRIMEKAPHYSVIHVDDTLKNIQRTFTFDGVSLYDAMQDIAEEIGCLFIFNSNSNEDGSIARTISVYDVESNCKNCGYRGEFTGTCPKCGSTDIDEGYGKDTTIYVTDDELGDEIQFTTDTGSVKNCFKLEGGDDLMTATIRNCNPNGTDYIWYISDDVKEDMSEELVAGIESYDELYDWYQNEYHADIDSSVISDYNALVKKYQEYNPELETVDDPIVGYPALMQAYYQTIDLSLYLESVLMPDASLSNTSAEEQAALLTASNLSPVAVEDVSNISLATANNAVLAMAKTVVDSRYKVSVNSTSSSPTLASQTWTGNFIVTNYSDDEDTATSSMISIEISDDYEAYVRQKIQKTLTSDDTEDLSISGLFNKSSDGGSSSEFAQELKRYCLDSLSTFYDACEACLNILIEQGLGDGETWGIDMYESIYVPYYTKLGLIEAEMKVREDEIVSIVGMYASDGTLDTYGLQNYLDIERNSIQEALNFQDFLGTDLWLEFCLYRREDKYINSNYISDGLNNAEIFSMALDFIEVATNEIYKSAELQHSISATLKNLLAIKKFEPLIEYFEVGNWIRVLCDDTVYKLRLIGYEIDFDNLDTLSVDFSDVTKTAFGMTDQSNLIKKASSMATSYDSVQRQANNGSEGKKTIDGWVKDGLNITNTKIISSAQNQTQSWDSNGMLFRQYDTILDSFNDTQLKIINSTLAVTDDNWETVKTAIGKFYYTDPTTGDLVTAYGVNAETVVGELIIGENLGIYTSSGSMTFDQNGLKVTNGTNTFIVDPNSDKLLEVLNGSGDVLWVDSSGNANFSGTITASSGSIGNWTIGANKIYGGDGTDVPVAAMQLPRSAITWVFAAGGTTHDSYANCPFRVSKAGVLYATDAHITGEVTATSGSFTGTITASEGTIGGWTISSTALYSDYNTSSYRYRVYIQSLSVTTSSINDTWVYSIQRGSSGSSTLTARMYIRGDGEIYTVAGVDANSVTASYFYVDTDGYYLCEYTSGIGTSAKIIAESGFIAGTTSYGNYMISMTGNAYATGDWYSGSDESIKDNISPLASKTENFIDKIEPISFTYKNDPNKKIHFGITSQNATEAIEAENINPNDVALLSTAIDNDGDEFGTVAYDELIGIMLYEIKALKSELQNLHLALDNLNE